MRVDRNGPNGSWRPFARLGRRRRRRRSYSSLAMGQIGRVDTSARSDGRTTGGCVVVWEGGQLDQLGRREVRPALRLLSRPATGRVDREEQPNETIALFGIDADGGFSRVAAEMCLSGRSSRSSGPGSPTTTLIDTRSEGTGDKAERVAVAAVATERSAYFGSRRIDTRAVRARDGRTGIDGHGRRRRPNHSPVSANRLHGRRVGG